jgi:biopolymer transport protein ExbD
MRTDSGAIDLTPLIQVLVLVVLVLLIVFLVNRI